MTSPLRIDSCEVEKKKLDEVINGKIQICSEKLLTNFETMEPCDDISTTFNFVNVCAEFVLLIRIVSRISKGHYKFLHFINIKKNLSSTFNNYFSSTKYLNLKLQYLRLFII